MKKRYEMTAITTNAMIPVSTMSEVVAILDGRFQTYTLSSWSSSLDGIRYRNVYAISSGVAICQIWEYNQ